MYGNVVQELSGLARGLVVRRWLRRHGQCHGQVMCPVGEREKRRRQRINLRGCETELRHLQCRSKPTGLQDLGRNVIR